MKVRTILLCAALMMVMAAATGANAQKGSKEDYKKHPGYVDFSTLEIFDEENAKVEVHLKQPMLKLVSEFVKIEEPELYELLGKLALVRVHVFKTDETMTKKFLTQSSKTFKTLEDKGWERIVRVREDNEHVHVYVKPSKEYEFLKGIVVIAAEDDDEAVFVNIVGDIYPQDVGKLGRHFGIEELDSVHYEKKK